MSQNLVPIGVAIVHQYYPGFIDLPVNTQFVVCSPELTGSIQVLAHVRPLVVTDFRNKLVRKRSKGGCHPIDIRRPISGIKKEAISVDARGFEGRAGPAIAVEKEIQGRVFYQDVYTGLQFCAEFADHNGAESIGLRMHRRLLERFIGTYRHLNPDIRVPLKEGLPEAEAPVRIGYYLYSPAEKRLPLEERIINAQPDKLSVSMVALGRGTRALQDHAGERGVLEARAELLGRYLFNGFSLSENLLAIERLADLAFSAKQLRAAAAEAMSIAEIAVLQARQRFRAELRSDGRICEPDDVNWKFLINAILPALLDLFDGDKASMMRRANEVLCLRHGVVHKGHSPTSQEVNQVLSFVRTLLTILELPDQFKGNWKRRTD
jgi:hypothetical protein